MAKTWWFVERFLISIPACTTHTDSRAREIVDRQIRRTRGWSIQASPGHLEGGPRKGSWDPGSRYSLHAGGGWARHQTCAKGLLERPKGGPRALTIAFPLVILLYFLFPFLSNLYSWVIFRRGVLLELQEFFALAARIRFMALRGLHAGLLACFPRFFSLLFFGLI